ncbi:MAG TPA: beta-phosphoglucomutase family hydrolase [Dongiaceae bacterium]|jgi:beta-phosphoglucomutase family hydrolase|nr:beta-phosphoglucomutase family hydrolase [Dongiaceae bacterium]
MRLGQNARTSYFEAITQTMMKFDAVIFDMDGVVTQTASVHAAAWKDMFDEYLRRRAHTQGEPFGEFNTVKDYLAFVDGRPRYQGVAAFLKSRGISLPLGTPLDSSSMETICGLGNRKNEIFNRIIAANGVAVFPSTLELITALRSRGIHIGLATSSKNGDLVLGKAGVREIFETCVDGLVSAQQGLRGKPEPDIFIWAAANLGTTPERAIVVEDAVSGVRAGANGRFALVLGIARENNAAELAANGADVVVSDLDEVTVSQLDQWVEAKQAKLEATAGGADKR